MFCFKGCQVYIRNLLTSFMGESTWISFRKFTWVMRFGNTGRSKSCAFVLRLSGGSSLKPHPLDWSLPGSSVHQILQARILEWVTISSSRHLPNPRIEPMSFLCVCESSFFFLFFFFIVVDFVIHWNETAMGLHVFPTLLCPLNCRQILYPLSHQGKVLRGCEIHIGQQVRYWATLLLPSALIPWSDGVHLTPNKHYKTSARNKSFVSEFDRLGELL